MLNTNRATTTIMLILLLAIAISIPAAAAPITWPNHPTMDIDRDSLDPAHQAIGANLYAIAESTWHVYLNDQPIWFPGDDFDFDDIYHVVKFDSAYNLTYENMGGLALYTNVLTYGPVVPNGLVTVTAHTTYPPFINFTWHSGPGSNNSDGVGKFAIFGPEFDPGTHPVPEPGTMIMIAGGLFALFCLPVARGVRSARGERR